MSNRSASAFVAKLGIIVPDSTSCCTHGYSCSPAAAATAVGGNYPYNATAAFIMDRLLFHIVPNEEDPPTLPPPAVRVFKELVKTNNACMDPNLIKSLIMIGTDILHGSSRDDKDSLALTLVLVILHIEEFFRLVSLQSANVTGGFLQINIDIMVLVRAVTKVLAKLELDCMTRIILFYDSRNPCNCLDQAKEEHKIAIGMCWNPGCHKNTRDTKLLMWGGCKLEKYCCRECQVAHWPEHKKKCKKLNKMLKLAKQK